MYPPLRFFYFERGRRSVYTSPFERLSSPLVKVKKVILLFFLELLPMAVCVVFRPFPSNVSGHRDRCSFLGVGQMLSLLGDNALQDVGSPPLFHELEL